MSVIDPTPNRFYPLSILRIWGMCVLVWALLGCSRAETKKSSGELTHGGSAAGLERLKFAESHQDSALFELVYSNAGSKEISDVRYAQGRLLMNDQGVFRFEQAKKEPQRNLIVYFNPDQEICVVFPKLKIAYHASPEILTGPEGEKLVAAYDGIRMVLCLSNVWNNPEPNSIEIGTLGDTLSLQQQGRPFHWNVDMDPGASVSPITCMRARRGFRQLCTLERKTSTIHQYSRSNKDAFMKGSGGQLLSGNKWSLSLQGHSRQSDFEFTPYPIKKTESDAVSTLFESPPLDPSFQVQQLTLDLIQDWMGFR